MSRLPENVEAVSTIRPVSRETAERLETYAALLAKWQKSQNLVSPTTLPRLWSRHMADSAQALALLPDARVWVDLGSGAGFPGLVTAILLTGTEGAEVHLVESNSGKAAFLKTVARETGAPAVVHVGRIEVVAEALAGTRTFEAVSARALAPLDKLLGLAEPFLERGATAVFHKGQDFVSELRVATQSWEFDLLEHKSQVDPDGVLALLRDVRRRS